MNKEKNNFIGLALIGLIIVTYSLFFQPKPEPQATTPAQTENISDISAEEKEKVKQAIKVETDNSQARTEYGIFSKNSVGTAQDIKLENKDLAITISTRGAVVKEALLKNYKTWDGKPLNLITPTSSKQSLTINTPSGVVDLSNLYFEPVQITTGADGEQVLSLKVEVDENRFIEQKFSLAKEGYILDNQFNIKGLDNQILDQKVAYNWNNKIQRAEELLEGNSGERAYSTITYFLASEKSFDEVSISQSELEEEKVNEPVNWLAFKQHFFLSAILPVKSVNDVNLSVGVPLDDSTVVKDATMKFNIALADLKSNENNFRFYFGPNGYKTIKEIAPGFKDNVSLGWGFFAYVNKWIVIPVFDFLQNYISNYGLIILLLVIFIKLLLAPLSYKSYLSMAKMKVLKPEIEKLKEETGGDATKMQMAQMELYRKAGVNPLSGCIPLLLQMPILFALFRFFPNSIELRQESFLWAHDLSTYDSILNLGFEIPFYGSHVSGFCLLMTVSTIVSSMSNSQMTTAEGPMKNMQYVMPIMFLFMMNSFPAGLSYYYFLSNLVTIAQQQISKRFVNEDKIKAKLEENKVKNANKKGSSFQQKLSEAMKEAQKNKKKK